MNEKQEAEAIFWCGLLSPVLFGGLDKGEVRQELRILSNNEVVFPDGTKRSPSLSTLKRKYNKYIQDGFNGMGRKPRNDRGVPRVAKPEVIETAIAAKKEQAKRSPVMINQILEAVHGQQIPRSTMYRH